MKKLIFILRIYMKKIERIINIIFIFNSLKLILLLYFTFNMGIDAIKLIFLIKNIKKILYLSLIF